MDLDKFRLDFPEFADPVAYSNEQLTFWGDLSELEISSTRFGAARAHAVELLAAHYMAVSRLNGMGTTPGAGGGLVASKSVGDVSVSYDNSGVTGVTGSLWSGTRYGVLLSQMMRRYGAGALQL